MTRRLKLIEHSIPLEAINAACEEEKQIKVGKHTSIHQWFAPRPLASNRAVIYAQYVDDPSAWPDRFPTPEEQQKERRRLHKIIEDMVEWPKSTPADRKRFDLAIEAARVEIARSVAWGLGEAPPARAKDVVAYLQAKAPPVYDPFCGGGSIPLEAQRLGLRAYGSDLNPVAVLITKALIEFPPKFAGRPPVHPGVAKDLAGREWRGAEGLAEDVRRYGQWMRDEAEKRIGHLYPKARLPNGRAAGSARDAGGNDGSEAVVIAWLWARTVSSPDPAQRGAHVPLASSFVLSSKAGREAIVKPVLDLSAPGGWRFEVKAEGVTAEELGEATKGTKTARGSNFQCVLSGSPITGDHVKSEGQAGRVSQRLMAVVAEGKRGRSYLSPTSQHEQSADVARPVVPELEQPLPDDPRNFWTVQYGLSRWADLFTPRQLTALTTFSDLVETARDRALEDARASRAFTGHPDPDRRLADAGTGPAAYADAVATYLALCVDRLVQCQTSLNRWFAQGQKIQPTFDQHNIPMRWDYAEGNLFSSSTGSWDAAFKYPAMALERWGSELPGNVRQEAAQDDGEKIFNVAIVTDPPYYDNIGYADLSDFFYVWLRRSLKSLHSDLFRRLVTPKGEELVATPYRHGSKSAAERFFIDGIAKSFYILKDRTADMPITIYYAFKQSEVQEGGLLSPGWASFLSSLIGSNLQFDATWPVRTEHSSRSIGQGTNALASSVVLVCRSRPDDAPASTRREFLRELRPAMRQAILDHQTAGVPLPDRRQAAIGPGIGIFSKYSLVRETDGSEMRVATALALVNREIDGILAEGTEAFDPETRFALDWYDLHRTRPVAGGAGSAIAMLQGFNLSEARINASGIFRARGGDAKLLTRDEMLAADPKWRPSRDGSPTVWEMAQHLARAFLSTEGGTDAAGRLLAERRGAAPDVLLLAERLYELTAAKEPDEALVWNQLQTAWPEIERAADRAEAAGVAPPPVQPAML
ncbi:DUF1156 domain-containing protein [Aureimonas leprariae]|uniref:DUF1156 domain-containing protein n=1 Tax=Plantimonas leprariae TaxID=2615207 RepID=A0A7V7PMT9_9HYPH|nr:DUF1156 domain-containing protein [Aureimonas leprariae]KAB0678449.1 DUF1156 domain-containing protein [Aureimonas leprariae]